MLLEQYTLFFLKAFTLFAMIITAIILIFRQKKAYSKIELEDYHKSLNQDTQTFQKTVQKTKKTSRKKQKKTEKNTLKKTIFTII